MGRKNKQIADSKQQIVLFDKLNRLSVMLRRFLVSPGFLILGGLGLILVSITHNYLRYRSLSLNAELMAKYGQMQSSATELPHPTKIFIQWFVDTEIGDGVVIDNNWTILSNKAVYITRSARPGTKGNTIIYGHNTRQILGNIRALKGGERITLTMSDGKDRIYKVVAMTQVNPDQVELLEPTKTEVLTLYTCAGIADSQRFVVRAVPIE